MLFRQTSAGGTTDLYGFEFGTVFQTAADIENDLPKGCSHGNFDKAGILNGTGQGEGLTSRAVFRTDGTEPVSTLKNDFRNIGICFYII